MGKRVSIVLATLAVAIAGVAAPAQAMQPPGHGAKDRFGCVDGENQAVAGHPGATGLLHAAPRVAALTGNDAPTAWNAVERAGPIELGSC